MKRKQILLGAAFVAASAFASAAMAEGYVGGAIGRSEWKVDCSGTTTCDKNDTGFKVYGGYMFMPYVGVEAAYLSLGKAKATFTDPVLGNVSGELKGDGFAAFAVGAFPIQDFVLFGKLGFASIKAKVNATSSTQGTANESDTNSDFAWGLGAGYNITKNFGVRAEWERYRVKFLDEKSDVDMISLGAHFRF
jgi:OmpA-OmpF porin, OOP family